MVTFMQITEKVEEITNPEKIEDEEREEEIIERKSHSSFPLGLQIVICLIFWVVVAVLYFFLPDMFNDLAEKYKTEINTSLFVSGSSEGAGVSIIDESN